MSKLRKKKRIHKKEFLRKVSQIFFLFLFLFLFVKTQPEIEEYYYLVKCGTWADIFFRADPYIIISSMVSAREFIIGDFTPAIVLVFLAVFFGSYFCAWICPLGTCIDISGLPLKSRQKKSKALPYRVSKLKYYILISILLLTFAGINISGFLDPITIFFRALTFSFDPWFSKIIRAIFDPLGLTPVISKFSEPVYSFLNNKVLTFEVYKFKYSWVYFLIFIAIILLNIIHRRFWCSNLCPLGAIYGLFGKISLFRRVVKDNCVECRKCSRECNMGAISYKTAKKCDLTECSFCYSCEKVCPVDSISFPLKKFNYAKTSIKEYTSDFNNNSLSLSRRGLLKSIGAAAVSFPIIKLMADKEYINKKILRPPGVRFEDEFLAKCIRCGECMRVCTKNALHPSVTQAGLEGLWSPLLIPRIGYCEHYCNLCSQVCPTGAIKRLSLPEKMIWKIGLAEFDHKRCLPWSKNINCSVCEEACPLPKKAIELHPKEIINANGEKEIIQYPVVLENLCIGCGICENKCPLEGDSAIRVFKRQ